MDAIQLQPPEKQGRYKLSFYTASTVYPQQLIEAIHFVLDEKGVCANIIWSVDEIAANGLLDVILARASKRHAIQVSDATGVICRGSRRICR